MRGEEHGRVSFRHVRVGNLDHSVGHYHRFRVGSPYSIEGRRTCRTQMI